MNTPLRFMFQRIKLALRKYYNLLYYYEKLRKHLNMLKCNNFASKCSRPQHAPKGKLQLQIYRI